MAHHSAFWEWELTGRIEPPTPINSTYLDGLDLFIPISVPRLSSSLPSHSLKPTMRKFALFPGSSTRSVWVSRTEYLMKKKATGSDMQICACRVAEKNLKIWARKSNEAEGQGVKGEGGMGHGNVETGEKSVEELMELKEKAKVEAD